jgi:hypothetical protein
MCIRKSDATLHQHRLETLFDSLLGMKTERCQEDVRHLPLLGQRQVASGMTEPVFRAARNGRLKRHKWPYPRARRGNTPD